MVATLPRVPNADCQNLAGLAPESLHWSANVLQHSTSPPPHLASLYAITGVLGPADAFGRVLLMPCHVSFPRLVAVISASNPSARARSQPLSFANQSGCLAFSVMAEQKKGKSDMYL
jgi:hypothetical protein